MRKRLKTALHRARDWNRTCFRLPQIFGALALLWIGLWLLDMPGVHSVLQRVTEEREEQQDSTAEAYEASHSEWTRRYPTILFIDFDHASIVYAAETAPQGAGGTLRANLATLLDWLHSDQSARPSLVFVDLSPLGEPNSADAELVRAIHGWANDRNSAPMALFAGRACRTSNVEEPSSPLAPSPYSADVLPRDDGRYAAPLATGKIIWSCPTYDQTIERNFWYCAEANDSGKVVALLSPGWFAAAVSEGDRAFIQTAEGDLASATVACLGSKKRFKFGPNQVDVDRNNRVMLTFNPADVTSNQVDGNPVVSKFSAVEILKDLTAGPRPANVFKDKIVVIGSTGVLNHQNDLISTKFGYVPGSVLVAEELRSGWANGYPRAKNWWASQIIATLLVTTAFVLLNFASRFKRQVGKGRTLKASFIIIITNLHVLVIIVIAVLSLLAFQLGKLLFDLDWYKIAFAFVLTEVLFICTSVVQELHGESLEDHHSPSPSHAIDVDHGAGGADKQS